MKCLDESCITVDIEVRPLTEEDKLFKGSINDLVFTELVDELKQKVEASKEQKRKAEIENEEKFRKIQEMDENIKNIKSENSELKLDKEKLL